MEQLGASRCFGGSQQRFRHHSAVLNCAMTFSVYLPPQAEQAAVPVLTWLSGLTCTDENFVAKSGAQRYAAEYGMALLVPDTSPRGEGVPGDPAGGLTNNANCKCTMLTKAKLDKENNIIYK